MKKVLTMMLFFLFLFGQVSPALASEILDANQLISSSKELLGIKYKYGGTTKQGFDCSGYTSYVFAQFNIKLPHSSKAQYKLGEEVKKGEWKVGDLLFFNTSGKGISHVGIYIGENKMIHAGSKGITIDDLTTSEYYKKRYVGAKRVATFEVPQPQPINQAEYADAMEDTIILDGAITVISTDVLEGLLTSERGN